MRKKPTGSLGYQIIRFRLVSGILLDASNLSVLLFCLKESLKTRIKGGKKNPGTVLSVPEQKGINSAVVCKGSDRQM